MIRRVIQRLGRRGNPALFHYGRDNLWTNRYVSTHVLNAHIDSTIDDASRRPEIIDAGCSAVIERAGDAPGNRLLDLGCGPGLHAQRFADAGFDVTGIDFSRTSISFARRRTQKRTIPGGGSVRFRRRDYLKRELPRGFAIVTLIYGNFCVISTEQRSRLLERIYASLLPGGYFVFDVFTRRYVDKQLIKNDWYVSSRGGFWHRGDHLVLEESHAYENETVFENRYTVIPAFGRVRTYHIWYRPYTPEEIRETVAQAGFTEIELRGNPSGSPFEFERADADPENHEWIGVLCRKPPESEL